MRILSIQVGKPKTLTYRGQSVTTGIFKDPVPGPVMLRTLNLEGDGQADLKVHGGKDKALYAYSNDVYPLWRKTRPHDHFLAGAMGENLTMESLPEDSIFIGDTYQLGRAVVQVSEPRFPCYKLAIKFNDQKILDQFMKIGRPGVYFRVLEEGLIDLDDELRLKDREKVQLSIDELFKMTQKPFDLARVREILKIQGLTEKWRRKLKEKLEDSV